MAIGERPLVADPRWNEYPAEERADAIITAMALGGIEHVFFCSGLELVFFQEAVARAQQRGWPTPRLLTMTHESAAVHAAMGVSMVTNRPAATVVHVDVGTINMGTAYNTAWHGRYPILMTAEAGPRALAGSMRGGRDAGIAYVQEPRDQGEILRQYTKADHRLEYQDNPGLMVSRLLQIAVSEPKGPVYMSMPREIAMLPVPGRTAFPSLSQMGLAGPAWPDPTQVHQVVRWLLAAENPCIYVDRSGRNPSSVEALILLAELLALPVMGAGYRMNFPTTHSLYGTGPQPKDADLLLIFECMTPFVPPHGSPKADAKIVWVDNDPVQSRYKTREFSADAWITADTECTARAIYELAHNVLTSSDMSRIEERRARLDARKRRQLAEQEESALKARDRQALAPRWVGHELGEILEPETILVDDTTAGSPYIRGYTRRSLPGTYFSSGASGGGFGPAAALGARLAAPDREVVLVSGDGFYLFGEPLAALLAAQHHGAPYLTLVMENRSYGTGTGALKRTYPEGVAVETGNYAGGVFDPAPDLGKLAEAAGAYGETVRTAEEVGPALRRGLDQVRKGVPAVIAAWLPTHVEEMSLPQI